MLALSTLFHKLSLRWFIMLGNRVTNYLSHKAISRRVRKKVQWCKAVTDCEYSQSHRLWVPLYSQSVQYSTVKQSLQCSEMVRCYLCWPRNNTVLNESVFLYSWHSWQTTRNARATFNLTMIYWLVFIIISSRYVPSSDARFSHGGQLWDGWRFITQRPVLPSHVVKPPIGPLWGLTTVI